MKKDKDMKRGDIDFQYANNVVAVKLFDNRGVTMARICLEECNNKVSTVTRGVKGQSVKISVPCPGIIKDYNSGMGGVDLLDQKTSTYKLDRKSSGGRYYLRLFFDLMDISVVNSHTVYKVLCLKGMELLDFKIILAKSLISKYNSRSRNTPVSHVSCRKVLPTSVPLHFLVLQKLEESVDSVILEGLKTKHTFNAIHVELFCAWLPAIDLETVLQISIPKFTDILLLLLLYINFIFYIRLFS